jgi:predicted MPP superfamily phosphohydrolase
MAGHTHGGQVRLPLIGAPVIPTAYGKRDAAGLFYATTDVFVTTGIGTSHLPIRLGVPPEIAILDLQPR